MHTFSNRFKLPLRTVKSFELMSICKLESVNVVEMGEFYDVLDELRDYANYFIHRLDKMDSGDGDNFAFNVDQALTAYHTLSVRGRDLLLDYSHVALAFHDEAQRNFPERKESKYPKKGEISTEHSHRYSKKLAKINKDIDSEFAANLLLQVEAQKARAVEEDLFAMDDVQDEHSGDGNSVVVVLEEGTHVENPIVIED